MHRLLNFLRLFINHFVIQRLLGTAVKITAKNIEYCLQGITRALLNKIRQLECNTCSLEICHLNSCTTLSACQIATVLRQDPYQHAHLSLISWQCCFSCALCAVIKLRLSRDSSLGLQPPFINNSFPKHKVSLSNRKLYVNFEPTDILSDHVS